MRLFICPFYLINLIELFRWLLDNDLSSLKWVSWPYVWFSTAQQPCCMFFRICFCFCFLSTSLASVWLGKTCLFIVLILCAFFGQIKNIPLWQTSAFTESQPELNITLDINIISSYTVNSLDLHTNIYESFVHSVGYLSWLFRASLNGINVIVKLQIAYCTTIEWDWRCGNCLFVGHD